LTPSELKYRIECAGNEPHFFTRSTMKFFGDSMRNYGVRLAFVVSEFDPDGNYVKDGIRRQAWELWRKHSVKHGLRDSAYFDTSTFKRIYPKREMAA
jgi:hypothetical protein